MADVVWPEDLARQVIKQAVAEAVAAEREACAKVAEAALAGGCLCPYGRDKPGDPTWGHSDEDICPMCGANGAESLIKCRDTASGRIASAIRERSNKTG